MRKEFLILTALLILLAGCTDTAETGNEQAASGTISFTHELTPTSISQGDSAVLTMTLTNNYIKPLKNVQVRFEPNFSGITFSVDGPEEISPSATGTWVVDIQAAAGTVAKDYVFRPIICFDYSQDHRAYFRVAPEEPSTSAVDYSTSEVGPITMTFNNLRGINAKTDYNSLDITINYAYSNTFQGLTNNTSIDNQLLDYGKFEIDSNELRLRALQGSTRLKESTIGLDNYCRKLESGKSYCEFPPTDSAAKVYANSQFGFRINVSNTIESELETYFLNTINYTICLRSVSDYTFTVVRAQ